MAPAFKMEETADAFADRYAMEGRGIGGISGVVQTAEAWVVFLDRRGNEAWAFAEAEGGLEVASESLAIFDRNGRTTGSHPLPSLPSMPNDGVMADHIMPVKGGFLCDGYRINREDSGLLPMGNCLAFG